MLKKRCSCGQGDDADVHYLRCELWRIGDMFKEEQIVELWYDKKKIVELRQFHRTAFEDALEMYGLMVIPEVARRWWPGTD